MTFMKQPDEFLFRPVVIDDDDLSFLLAAADRVVGGQPNLFVALTDRDDVAFVVEPGCQCEECVKYMGEVGRSISGINPIKAIKSYVSSRLVYNQALTPSKGNEGTKSWVH